ncbi:MAG: HNH endonuclease [Stenotrophobium sp.]
MSKSQGLTADQVRSARSLLKWSQLQLAESAGVAISTIADFERGERTPIPNNLTAIRDALERAGARFLPGGVVFGYDLKLFFITLTGGFEMNVRYSTYDSEHIRGLLSLFGEVNGDKLSISVIQSATPELKRRVAAFAAERSEAIPQLQALSKNINDLGDSEFFVMPPEKASSSADQLVYEQLVHRLNNEGDETYGDHINRLFGDLLTQYDLVLRRTDRHVLIGPKNVDRRKCRFCGGTTAQESVKFKKVAHAIPAALGNKHLKLADECDTCNSHFGDNIEPALIEILNIQRVFLGTQGRGSSDGRPTLKYQSETLVHDGQRMVVKTTNISEDAAGVLTVRLGKGVRFVPANCYRALVKIALSVIPAEQLPHFRRTILWLRKGEKQSGRLPKVATAIVPLPPDPSAQISLYIRKENSELPHVVAEFRLGCFIYVYALPYSDLDSSDLYGFFDRPKFREVFRHYASVSSWTHQDFDREEEINLTQTIKVTPRRAPESDGDATSPRVE